MRRPAVLRPFQLAANAGAGRPGTGAGPDCRWRAMAWPTSPPISSTSSRDSVLPTGAATRRRLQDSRLRQQPEDLQSCWRQRRFVLWRASIAWRPTVRSTTWTPSQIVSTAGPRRLHRRHHHRHDRPVAAQERHRRHAPGDQQQRQSPCTMATSVTGRGYHGSRARRALSRQRRRRAGQGGSCCAASRRPRGRHSGSPDRQRIAAQNPSRAPCPRRSSRPATAAFSPSRSASPSGAERWSRTSACGCGAARSSASWGRTARARRPASATITACSPSSRSAASISTAKTSPPSRCTFSAPAWASATCCRRSSTFRGDGGRERLGRVELRERRLRGGDIRTGLLEELHIEHCAPPRRLPLSVASGGVVEIALARWRASRTSCCWTSPSPASTCWRSPHPRGGRLSEVTW